MVTWRTCTRITCMKVNPGWIRNTAGSTGLCVETESTKIAQETG